MEKCILFPPPKSQSVAPQVRDRKAGVHHSCRTHAQKLLCTIGSLLCTRKYHWMFYLLFLWCLAIIFAMVVNLFHGSNWNLFGLFCHMLLFFTLLGIKTSHFIFGGANDPTPPYRRHLQLLLLKVRTHHATILILVEPRLAPITVLYWGWKVT